VLLKENISNIDGVFLTPLKVIDVPGGDVLHGMKCDDPGYAGFSEAYFSTVEPGVVKAWKRHRQMVLNLIVPTGSVRFVLYDDREDSVSNGFYRQVILSRKNYYRLTVPPMLWMGFQGADETPSLLLNIADIPHAPIEVDRKDIKEIKYDWELNTETIPKPMVTVGGRPILWHIMSIYSHYGNNEFYLALGYKAQIIKEYFLHYRSLNSDFMVDLSSGVVEPYHTDNTDWKVTLVDTGLESMTGGRVKRLQPFIGNETCMLTYGDGLADIDLDSLLEFHKSHGKMVTVSAVHPNARFGELDLEGQKVINFQEKPQTRQGWINGGYFVIEPNFFDLIECDETILEREPLEKAAEMGELMAYGHEGYWQCMDAKRDRDHLERLWNSGDAPWKVW
jgi:glucose-1-phosphate cytidylyltransferase